jgi:hypothetical protein
VLREENPSAPSALSARASGTQTTLAHKSYIADMKYGLQERQKSLVMACSYCRELRPLPFAAAGVLEMVLMAACDSVALVLPNEFRLLFFTPRLYVQHDRL